MGRIGFGAGDKLNMAAASYELPTFEKLKVETTRKAAAEQEPWPEYKFNVFCSTTSTVGIEQQDC